MEIPVYNLERLESKLLKLNKRAEKLGFEKFTLTISKRFTKSIGKKDSERLVDFAEVSLTGPTIKINGWQFVAKFELSESGTIVHNIMPEISIPSELKSRAGECEHCQSNRARKDTFILIDESGILKQVGRQCLKDYLGYHGTPEHILQIAQIAYEINNISEGDDESDQDHASFGHDFRIPGKSFLIYVCTACRLFGYKNRIMVQDSFHPILTTGESAWLSYISKSPDELQKSISAADREQAKLVEDWINSLEGKNDYESNIKILLTDGVRWESKNILASAVQGYNRAKESESREKLVNEHFGEVGKRQQMILTYLGEKSFETQFGVMSIMRFRTETGNLAIWKTGTGWNKQVSVGCSVSVKATIKEHSEYKGFKQTLLNRVTLL